MFKKGDRVTVKEPRSGRRITTVIGKFIEYAKINGVESTDYCLIQISPYAKLFTLTDFVSKGRIQ